MLRLDEELDLANAAAAEFRVVARDRDIAAAAMAADLPLDRLDVANRREIQMLAPEKRADGAQERASRRRVAGDGPRLDQRRALPVLPQAGVISLRRRGRYGERRRRGVRPQAEIDAEDIAVARPVLEQPGEALREPDENLVRGPATGDRRGAGIVERHQIDVAGEIELAAAELAQRQHRQPGAAARRGGIGKRQLPLPMRLAQEKVHRVADRGVGEPAERRRHAPVVPRAGDGRGGRREGGALPGAPENPPDPGLVLLRGHAGVQPVERARKRGLRAVVEERAQHFGPGQRATPEKRRIAEQRVDRRVFGARFRRGAGGAPGGPAALGGGRVGGRRRRRDGGTRWRKHGASLGRNAATRGRGLAKLTAEPYIMHTAGDGAAERRSGA